MPLVSVSTVRGASNAGPVASTVTPGSTAPDVSLTVPVMEPPCAHAIRGARHSKASSSTLLPRATITSSCRLQLVTCDTSQLVVDAVRTVKDKIRQMRAAAIGAPQNRIFYGLLGGR